MDILPVVCGVVPPVALASLAATRWGARAIAPAAALGALVAHSLLFWRLPTWPHQLWAQPAGVEWMLWGLLTAAVVRLGGRVGAACDAALAAAVVWLLTLKVGASWTITERSLHLGGAAAVAWLLAHGARRIAVPTCGSLVPWIGASLLLSVDAAVLTFGKSALLGQLAGAFAAAMGAAAGARLLWRRDLTFSPIMAGFVALTHVVLLAAGPTLSYLPWREAGLAVAGPALLWLLPSAFAERRPSLAAVLAAVLPLLPGAIAVWLLLGEADPYGG
ncbi:MAG: hypothetical protein RL398_2715 [Planctomycetota bacterium]